MEKESLLYRIKRCFVLEFYHFKMNFIATSKYKASYYLSILYELMNGAMNIVYFYVIFDYVNEMAGWNKEDILLLVAIGYFIDVTCVMLFIGVISIPEYISTGDLDVLLTKPINHKFLLSFRRPNSVQIINFIFALSFILMLLKRREAKAIQLILFFVSLIFSVVIMYLLMSILAYLSFWTVRIGNVWQIVEQFNSISNKPGELYPKIMRLIMTFGIPSLIIINNPARILVFQDYTVILTHTIPITVVLYFLNDIVFRKGIQHYSGAGG